MWLSGQFLPLQHHIHPTGNYALFHIDCLPNYCKLVGNLKVEETLL
jgi:hypothetical protein